MARVWRVVGGTDRGGIVVRAEEGLKSQILPRLLTGTLVEELELRGQRLHFRLLDGCGPPCGWISLKVGGRDLATPADPASKAGSAGSLASVAIHLGGGAVQRVLVSKAPSIAELKALLLKHPTWTGLGLDTPFHFKRQGDSCLLLDSEPADGELELVSGARDWAAARAALSCGATEEQANEALKSLASTRNAGDARDAGGDAKWVHLAKGLVLWKWHRFDLSVRELQKAQAQDGGFEAGARVLLALQICLGRWPEAAALAERSPEAAALISAWFTGASGHFAPSSAAFAPEVAELRPGLRQMDALIPTVDDVRLGVRLLLQTTDAAPRVSQPLVLYFHGNAENADTYKDPDVFAPLQAAEASALIVDFRGYGFSTGGSGPSLSTMNVDAERVCDALPEFFKARGLPWPWPGGFTLFGRSMGGICACHLAGLRGTLFDGVVLESTMCGSHGPEAAPPPEPPADGSGMGGGGGSRFAPPELLAAVSQSGDLCRTLVQAAVGGDQGPQLLAETDLGSFVHVMGSEDKIRGFMGRLLILHGELDTIVPVTHARRLCDAAALATRRLVTLGKGHNDISSSEKYVEALKKFLLGS